MAYGILDDNLIDPIATNSSLMYTFCKHENVKSILDIFIINILKFQSLLDKHTLIGAIHYIVSYLNHVYIFLMKNCKN